MHYVDGTFNPPPSLLPNNNEPNPAYTSWVLQDQTILSWIISIVTEQAFAQIIGHETSHFAWKALSTIYESTSQIML